MFEDFISLNQERKFNNFSNIDIHHYHSTQDLGKQELFQTDQLESYFRTVAAPNQFTDLILYLTFDGAGVYHEGGYTFAMRETCHWIAPFPKPSDNYFNLSSIIPFAKSGLERGLTMILDVETFDYTSSRFNSEGLVLAPLSHLDTTPMLRLVGKNVGVGQETLVSVTTSLKTTSNDAKDRFDPIDRDCYFEEEVELKHLPKTNFRYSMFNCLLEALLQNIEQDCQCIEGDFEKSFPGVRTCSGADRPCVKRNQMLFGTYHTIESFNQSVPCLASCIEQTFESSLSYSNYPNKNIFLHSIESCFVLKKIEKLCQDNRKDIIEETYPGICEVPMPTNLDCNNLTHWRNVQLADQPKKLVFQYAKDNLAKVTIFLEDSSAERIIREVKLSYSSLIASVGGLLGLFLGFSVISGIEVIYVTMQGLIQSLKGTLFKRKYQSTWTQKNRMKIPETVQGNLPQNQ